MAADVKLPFDAALDAYESLTHHLLPCLIYFALHASSGIVETIGYELHTGAFDRHS